MKEPEAEIRNETDLIIDLEKQKREIDEKIKDMK